MKKLICVLFFSIHSLVCFHTKLLAQVPVERIDAIMRENFNDASPGVALLISKKGSIVYRKSFGKADLELNVPMKVENVFQIGSITKQFTAISILMLWEQQKISLEDPIKKYLPEYPAHAGHITVHQLLNQTTGIVEMLSINDPENIPQKEWKSVDLIDIFKNEELHFEPGEKWEYSNSNYALLGLIIEKISGLSYAEFLDKHIFKPLHLSTSRNGNNSEIIPNRIPGYLKLKDGSFKNSSFLNLSYTFGGGSILSTVDDLAKWNEALVSYKLVQKQTLDKAFTNHKTINNINTDYGYGWFLNELQGYKTIEHSGGTRGFSSNGIYIPSEDIFIIMLTNSGNYPAEQISTTILAEVLNKPLIHPDAISLPAAELSLFEGIYKLDDGYNIKVAVEANELYVTVWGLKQKVLASSSNTFFIKGSFIEYEFLESDGGKISSIIYKNRGEKLVGIKQ